jgi:hypothetical protein
MTWTRDCSGDAPESCLEGAPALIWLGDQDQPIDPLELAGPLVDPGRGTRDPDSGHAGLPCGVTVRFTFDDEDAPVSLRAGESVQAVEHRAIATAPAEAILAGERDPVPGRDDPIRRVAVGDPDRRLAAPGVVGEAVRA